MSEIVFQGSTALTLDGKGRVTVPARHREQLSALCANQLTLTKNPAGCLMVWPRSAWEAFRAQLLTLPYSAEGWRRVFLGSAVDVEVDSGDRISIAPELRQFAGLGKDLLLVGMGRRLDLWDAARHAAQEAQTLATPMPTAIQDFVF